MRAFNASSSLWTRPLGNMDFIIFSQEKKVSNEMNVIEEENTLYATPYPALKKILEFLSPVDAIRLSQTCKKFRQSLPFYFIITGQDFEKSGPRWGHFCPEKWFDGPRLNKHIEHINISMEWRDQDGGNRKGKVWLQIIRNDEMILETEPELCGLANHSFEEVNINLTREDNIVKEYKPGDQFRIMRNIGGGGGHKLSVQNFKLVIRLQDQHQYDESFHDLGQENLELSVNEKPKIENDKLYRGDSIDQESILCTLLEEILLNIVEFLTPIDIIHLSQTCKELRGKLPFYLMLKIKDICRSGPHDGDFCPEKWFEGPKIDYHVKDMNISMKWKDQGSGNRKGRIWLEILRDEKVFFASSYFLCGLATHEWDEVNIHLTKEDALVRDFKPGDRYRFVRNVGGGGGHALYVQNFKVFLELERPQHDDLIYLTKRAKAIRSKKSLNQLNKKDEILIAASDFSVQGPYNGESEKWFDGPSVERFVKDMTISMKWQDQGYGNRKGKIWLQIFRGKELVFESSQTLCGLAGHEWETINIKLTKEDDVVNNLRPGDKYRFMRNVGGGGEHELHVSNFKAIVRLEDR